MNKDEEWGKTEPSIQNYFTLMYFADVPESLSFNKEICTKVLCPCGASERNLLQEDFHKNQWALNHLAACLQVERFVCLPAR